MVTGEISFYGLLHKLWKHKLTYVNQLTKLFRSLAGLDGTQEVNNISGMGNTSSALANEQFMMMGGMMNKERPPPPPHTNLLHMAGNFL